MLTDEKILEVAAYCLTKEGEDGLEYDYSNRSVIDFARAILAEVKLEDMLKQEEEFIKNNISKIFVLKHGFKFGHVCFFPNGFKVYDLYGKYETSAIWINYFLQKKSIKGGE